MHITFTVLFPSRNTSLQVHDLYPSSGLDKIVGLFF